MPNMPLWTLSIALILIVILSWLLGRFARFLLKRRAKLAAAASMVMSIVGSAAGFLVAWMIRPNASVWQPLSLLLALAGAVVAVAAYAGVAAHFQTPVRKGIAELVAGGESDRVEFKSTARVNTHTGAKDDRMELVIAKTISAFLNADGGTLIVGVDDEGTPLGLDRDLGTMKAPDHDRFELWLRDLLSITLGPNAAASVRVAFHELPDGEGVPRAVCQITAEASPRPVYLKPNKNSAPELWVRAGNSTRQLAVDSATEYVMHRWPLSVGSGLAAQFRAAMRFSEAS